MRQFQNSTKCPDRKFTMKRYDCSHYFLTVFISKFYVTSLLAHHKKAKIPAKYFNNQRPGNYFSHGKTLT